MVIGGHLLWKKFTHSWFVKNDKIFNFDVVICYTQNNIFLSVMKKKFFDSTFKGWFIGFRTQPCMEIGKIMILDKFTMSELFP